MVSATAESNVLKRMACADADGRHARNFRVCTSAECRYRLCGMTVAPIMPMATTIMSGLAQSSGAHRALPISRRLGWVWESPKISMP